MKFQTKLYPAYLLRKERTAECSDRCRDNSVHESVKRLGLAVLQETKRKANESESAAPRKETPEEEIDQPWELKQARERIVGSEYRRLERRAERAKVIAKGKPTPHDF
jgi:hypothetical protein